MLPLGAHSAGLWFNFDTDPPRSRQEEARLPPPTFGGLDGSSLFEGALIDVLGDDGAWQPGVCVSIDDRGLCRVHPDDGDCMVVDSVHLRPRTGVPAEYLRRVLILRGEHGISAASCDVISALEPKLKGYPIVNALDETPGMRVAKPLRNQSRPAQSPSEQQPKAKSA